MDCTPKRPLNMFMLYRQDMCRELSANGGKDKDGNVPYTGSFSKWIGERWKAESTATRQYYQLLADIEKEKHGREYPDYKYNPQQRRNSKKRKAEDDDDPQPPPALRRAGSQASASSSSSGDSTLGPVTPVHELPHAQFDFELRLNHTNPGSVDMQQYLNSAPLKLSEVCSTSFCVCRAPHSSM